ncbi:proline--tRNA ligase [Paenibacillus sp. GCM10012307]|uniref:Proline--tRNA ligase n=1 Tax=Paenibacillus roseus TaxID=2798579 RepID=A0A934MN58_9BACL|nr:proline--tRNA ligase [Paenibacillus roseus]MBJ6360656.1 proline--tRNA ligase [Paenibacillus roseus]
MLQSQLLMPTLREAPSDTEAASHQLLLRAGYIRQVAAGIYTFLPLGVKVLHKINAIIREELHAAGAQELLLPVLQPSEQWEESGRYHEYGPELMRIHDRHGREFALGPTHEEIITALVRSEIKTYRQLPLTLYQIQSKFRDERRPRFGLLRGREFMMKDAYSFSESREDLRLIYQTMFQAYERIMIRCGLDFRAVEADAGSIGGEGETHEFMALSEVGEDTIAVCSSCGYAANLEKAESAAPDMNAEVPKGVLRESPLVESFCTPGMGTIDELCSGLGLKPDRIIKTLIYFTDGKPVAVLVQGGHEVNEIKLARLCRAAKVELADEDAIRQLTGGPRGFIGPVGLRLPLIADRHATGMNDAVTGGGEQDIHLRYVKPGRDFKVELTGDIVNVLEGERCSRCSEGILHFQRGIEVGHVFELGTKYSGKMGAQFVNREGKLQDIIMGCYGIGISRLMAAIAEQHHDAEGIRWPRTVAPFQVHLLTITSKDEAQADVASSLYSLLRDSGLEVLLDNREERPGIKFKDADLFGIPVRIVIGKLASEGKVELKFRAEEESRLLDIEATLAVVRDYYNTLN